MHYPLQSWGFVLDLSDSHFPPLSNISNFFPPVSKKHLEITLKYRQWKAASVTAGHNHILKLHQPTAGAMRTGRGEGELHLGRWEPHERRRRTEWQEESRAVTFTQAAISRRSSYLASKQHHKIKSPSCEKRKRGYLQYDSDSSISCPAIRPKIYRRMRAVLDVNGDFM